MICKIPYRDVKEGMLTLINGHLFRVSDLKPPCKRRGSTTPPAVSYTGICAYPNDALVDTPFNRMRYSGNPDELATIMADTFYVAEHDVYATMICGQMFTCAANEHGAMEYEVDGPLWCDVDPASDLTRDIGRYFYQLGGEA